LAFLAVFGSGDCPLTSRLCRGLEIANEGIGSPDRKPQSPFAFKQPDSALNRFYGDCALGWSKSIASIESVNPSHLHVPTGQSPLKIAIS
jgi:hypothetical protein